MQLVNLDSCMNTNTYRALSGLSKGIHLGVVPLDEWVTYAARKRGPYDSFSLHQ